MAPVQNAMVEARILEIMLEATFDDPDHSVDEQRLITVGYSSRGRLLVVLHTERGKTVRIISARFATTHERKRHES